MYIIRHLLQFSRQVIILSDDYRNDKSGENNDKFFSESNEIDDFFAQFDEIAEGLNKDDTAGSGNIQFSVF